MARAIGLHGNGNMTIHEGEFKEGLMLMEQSVATFPTALPYRKLAAYWNSQGDAVKTDYYVHKTLDLDRNYALVFIAGFIAEEPTRRGVEDRPRERRYAASFVQSGSDYAAWSAGQSFVSSEAMLLPMNATSYGRDDFAEDVHRVEDVRVGHQG
jgi:hypothetical protein